ncbi:MAG: hypothetical protein CVV27_04945 [Candidatus Melainabacteria bacterium HGW-Melainabacteria-1]|nr:MAG: hypothetical protein CVV27_04945 [Candidatus Melainabacteria bacterium HGW-Melainabacteria-1]
MAGCQAEFKQLPETALNMYQQAWNAQTNDYEACIAAHYLARLQPTAQARLDWNRAALERALSANDERVNSFLPSLHLSLSGAYAELGQTDAAGIHEKLASNAAEQVSGPYGEMLRQGLAARKPKSF